MARDLAAAVDVAAIEHDFRHNPRDRCCIAGVQLLRRLRVWLAHHSPRANAPQRHMCQLVRQRRLTRLRRRVTIRS